MLTIYHALFKPSLDASLNNILLITVSLAPNSFNNISWHHKHRNQERVLHIWEALTWSSLWLQMSLHQTDQGLIGHQLAQCWLHYKSRHDFFELSFGNKNISNMVSQQFSEWMRRSDKISCHFRQQAITWAIVGHMLSYCLFGQNELIHWGFDTTSTIWFCRQHFQMHLVEFSLKNYHLLFLFYDNSALD